MHLMPLSPNSPKVPSHWHQAAPGRGCALRGPLSAASDQGIHSSLGLKSGPRHQQNGPDWVMLGDEPPAVLHDETGEGWTAAAAQRWLSQETRARNVSSCDSELGDVTCAALLLVRDHSQAHGHRDVITLEATAVSI